MLLRSCDVLHPVHRQTLGVVVRDERVPQELFGPPELGGFQGPVEWSHAHSFAIVWGKV